MVILILVFRGVIRVFILISMGFQGVGGVLVRFGFSRYRGLGLHSSTLFAIATIVLAMMARVRIVVYGQGF